MHWNLDMGTILFGVAQLVALIGAYYGLKTDNAQIRADLAVAILSERSERKTDQAEFVTEHTVVHADLKTTVMGTLAIVDTTVRDLAHRVSKLKSGQDEWTKSLRTRTHELANEVNALVLKVDRLERLPAREQP